MKKLILSLVIVLGSFVVVSAQTGKNVNGSKAQNDIVVPSKTVLTEADTKKYKSEADQKAAIKKELAAKKAVAKKNELNHGAASLIDPRSL